MNADLHIQTHSRNYPVWIRQGIPPELSGLIGSDKLFLVIDEHVEELHGGRIGESIGGTDTEIVTYRVPSGETVKSETEWYRLVTFLLENGVRRNTPMLAVGGGVTGDLAGFAAATALRGIPLIHMPTTLLAMVDSSIGGKTGINHVTGKNLIGAFHQPEAVVMDTTFLSTLPDREWANGLSEILKYAAIRQPALFQTCEEIFLSGDNPAENSHLTELIRKSVEVKASIVEEDEMEHGIRAWLNFGHTFAHALENSAGYGKISHGEAVYIGMIAASRMSVRLGSELDEIRFQPFRALYKLNEDLFRLPVVRLIEKMHSDKKKISGQLRLVLLRSWGEPFIYEAPDSELLRASWEDAIVTLNPGINPLPLDM